MAVKVFNELPYNLKANVSNTKKFTIKLKDFLYSNSFYSLEEFLISECFIIIIIEFYSSCGYSGYKFKHWYIFILDEKMYTF
jgi:hypothetical protein